MIDVMTLREVVSIETPFRYNSESSHENYNFLFQTIIQPDGNIVNFLPNLDSLPNDADRRELYKKGSKIHQAKVEKFFTRFLNRIRSIAPIISWIITIISVPLAFVRFIEKNSFDKVTIFLIILPILIHIFGRFLCKPLFKIVVKLLVRKGLRDIKP